MGDPVNFVDPSGLFDEAIAVVSVGVTVGRITYDFITGMIKAITIINSHQEVKAVCDSARGNLQFLLDATDTSNMCVEDQASCKQHLILEMMKLDKTCLKLYKDAWF